MTTVDAWKCDVCGKIFMKGDGGYLGNAEVIIKIDNSGQYDISENIKLGDVCLNCRSDLSIAIHKVIDGQ